MRREPGGPRLRLLLALSLAGAASAQESRPADGWVVLSVEEYRALRAKATPAPAAAALPPVALTRTRLEYELRVGDGAAVGQARLTVDALGAGWSEVAIPAAWRVGDVSLDGRRVALLPVAQAGAGPRLVFRHPGRAALLVELSLPLQEETDRATLSLPTEGWALTEARLELTQVAAELRVAGGVTSSRAPLAAGERVVVHGDARANAIALSWPRVAPAARTSEPLRLRAHLTQVIGLGEEGAQLSAEIALEVVQGAAGGVLLELGEGLVVNRVEGPGVADWDYAPGRLEVRFLDPVDRTTQLTVAGEARTPAAGAVAIPLLRLPEVERVSGGVAVEVVGAGQIASSDPRGLEPTEAAEVGGVVATRSTPSLRAFRYRAAAGAAPPALTVNVERYESEAMLVANAEEARFQVMPTREGKRLVRARYAVRNNERTFLSLRLPAGASLWSAAVAGRPIRPGRSGDALLLPLPRGRDPQASSFGVEVVYFEAGEAWSERGEARMLLPALDLPVSRCGLELFHPQGFALAPRPGAFRVANFEPPMAFALSEGAEVVVPAPGIAPAPGASPQGQGLVDRLVAEGKLRRRPGTPPLQVPFPVLGTSSFLASELTPEGTAPEIVWEYRQSKGASR